MPKQSKGPPSPQLIELRETLAQNLRAHIGAKYGRDIAETAVAQRVGTAAGVGKNTILRVLQGTGETDLRLDTLVRIADHLGTRATDLLHSNSRTKTTTRRKGIPVQSSTEPSAKGALQRRTG